MLNTCYVTLSDTCKSRRTGFGILEGLWPNTILGLVVYKFRFPVDPRIYQQNWVLMKEASLDHLKQDRDKEHRVIAINILIPI